MIIAVRQFVYLVFVASSWFYRAIILVCIWLKCFQSLKDCSASFQVYYKIIYYVLLSFVFKCASYLFLSKTRNFTWKWAKGREVRGESVYYWGHVHFLCIYLVHIYVQSTISEYKLKIKATSHQIEKAWLYFSIAEYTKEY